MKETQKVLMTILLVGLSLVTVAAADPTMSVSQQPTGIAINDTFAVEVTVNPAGGEIYAASYDLYFDTTVLEAIEQIQGDFLSQGGAETLEHVNEINNTRGKMTYVETKTGDVGGATEPGALASITFKVIGTGISDLTLDDVQFVDLTAEPEPTPTPTPTPESSGNGGTSSSSGGSSGYIPIVTTPTATPAETSATEDMTESSGVIEDSDARTPSGETDSAAAESASTATSAKTPSPPKSAIPGFAAASVILGLLAVVVILKSKGE